MAITPITPIPPAPELPQSTDPATFDARADAYVAWQSDVLAPGINTQAAATLANAQDAALSATAADERATDAETAKQAAEDARDAAGLYKQSSEMAEVSAWAAAAALGTDPDLFPQPLQPGKVLGAVSPTTVGWIDAFTPGDTLITVNPPRSGWIETGKHYLQSAYANLFAQIGLIPDVPVGLRWNALANPGTNPQLYDIKKLADGTLLTCGFQGANGVIYRSVDGGASWVNVVSGTGTGAGAAVSLVELSAGNVLAFFHSGGGVAVRKSTDWGQTWAAPIDIPPITSVAFAARSEDGSVVVAGANSSFKVICRSIDGGVSWATSYAASLGTGGFLDIKHLGSGTLLAVGYDNVVVRSTDHGASWTPATIPGASVPTRVDQSPNGTVFVSGGTATSPQMGWVARSYDMGQTWTPVNLPLGGIQLLPMACISDRLILAFYTGVGRPIARSADGGKTWEMSGSSLTNLISISRFLIEEDRVVCCGSSSGASPLTSSEPEYDYDTGSMFWVPSSGSTPEGYNSLIKAG